MKPGYRYVQKQEKLDFGNIYHIYNKAVGNELLFKTPDDYNFFLRKVARFLLPVADIYAYCLIPNHFHFLIRTKQEEELIELIKGKSDEKGSKVFQQSFSNFFNSYSKSYNKAHDRAGRLFLYPFKRILVDKDDYLLALIKYIHRNPIHHGIVKDFSDWKYSSYNAILSTDETKVNRGFVLGFFGSIEDFINFHEQNKKPPEIDKYYLE